MIHYQLRCASDHEFEGWFRSSSSFDDQASQGLLSCPHCGTADVVRALMAPSIRTSSSRALRPVQEGTSEASNASAPTSAPPAEISAANIEKHLPDVLLTALRRLRQDVENRCEPVGDRFADEALRMHRGEAEERAIYGSMSDDDRELLEDEGVDVHHIPWVSRSDS